MNDAADRQPGSRMTQMDALMRARKASLTSADRSGKPALVGNRPSAVEFYEDS